MTDYRQTILNFISRFSGSENTFLHGCCYWFARILRERFSWECCVELVHEPIEGHFLARINGRLYDVRGDVTDMYVKRTLEKLSDVRYEDYQRYRRLMYDCRDFTDRETT